MPDIKDFLDKFLAIVRTVCITAVIVSSTIFLTYWLYHIAVIMHKISERQL